MTIRPIRPGDADVLFPMIYRTRVTDTLLWDGPSSLDEYRAALAQRAAQHEAGDIHFFAIADGDRAIGSIDLRPHDDGFRADIGIWIGEPFHGRGFGSRAIGEIVAYGFDKLPLEKIEATVFVGNHASRRAFEKNGFVLEGTIRKAALERGRHIDEWLLGLTRDDHAT